jgi:AcrR family transcriptional regulator
MGGMSTAPTVAARPGRPRSDHSRQAILAAAGELVAELGYRAVTIEKIAQRSGTGKQTIYRWWPTKADVVMEALAAKADLHIPLPDRGELAGDLRDVLGTSFVLARVDEVADLLRALMAEAQVDPDFAARFRAQFLQRRRDALGVILQRAHERGDLRPGVSLHTAADLVFGILWYRLLAVPAPLDETLIEEIVVLLSASVAAPTR